MITRKLNDIMRFQKYVVHACIIPRNIILHGRTEMNGSYFAKSSCYLIQLFDEKLSKSFNALTL